MLGKARRGPLIPKGEKPGVRVKETRGIIRNFCVGVRDPWSYPKSLCGCKRPVEKSKISVWVLETRGDIRNFCVDIRGSQCRPKSYVTREMKTHGQGIT